MECPVNKLLYELRITQQIVNLGCENDRKFVYSDDAFQRGTSVQNVLNNLGMMIRPHFYELAI
ncbi:MAG TPA: DUF3392 domain-containing protein, partial [Idiomarina loihiensis]|nr:DUF3392 domain-containing protein [Idiomarina loihiensis]